MLQLNHVGLAARDAARLAELLQLLTGAGATSAEELPDDGVRVRFIETGQCKLELLEAMDPDSPVARFIQQRGEGLHHIAFTVDDIELKLSRLREAGFKPLSAKPRTGAGGKRIFFLHPKTTGRILIEFCQPASQWPLNIVGPATRLRNVLLATGRVRLCTSPSSHHVIAESAPYSTSVVNECESLVLFLPATPVQLPAIDGNKVLVCLTDESVCDAASIRTQWPETRLAVLPAPETTELWAALILRFWEANE